MQITLGCEWPRNKNASRISVYPWRLYQVLGGPRVSAAAVTDEFRAAQLGSEQHNSGMVLTALAKKLFRTLAKVIPQCGMASQAVAFNMFLAFFAVLLTALSLMKGKAVSKCHADFGGSSPRELATHIRVRVTPGGEHLVPGAYRLDRDAARWLADDKAYYQRHGANLW